MRHFTRSLPLYAALVFGVAACGDRSPSMPLRREVSITKSTSINGGAPSLVEADVVQSDLCAFDVRLQVNGRGKVLVVGKNESITLFTAPTLEVTLTNAANPEHRVTVGITGVFHETTDADGNTAYVITGRNLVHSPVFGLLLTRGVFTYTLDANGSVVEPLSGRGQTTDLCALLS